MYRRDLLEPSKAFVLALGEQLRGRVSAGLRAEPRVGGSLFRVANDARFGRDNEPYKAYLDFAFWEGPSGPRADPALILRITPTEIHLGAGVFALTGTALDRYRTALADPDVAADLDTRVTALLDDGAELSEPTRKRPPARLDLPATAARYAVREGFHVVRRYRRPAVVSSGRLVPWCADRLAPFAPLHEWLTCHTVSRTDVRR